MAVIALLVCAVSGPAVAQRGPASLYEVQRVRRVLESRGQQVEPQPEGKRVAFIQVAQEEVFIEDEALLIPIVLPRVAPTWPNAFHWLTADEVVRRELLFSVGEPYQQARVDESERNLRGLGVFALVQCVAVRGPDPSSVGVVVYTRDLWSLRAETAFAGAGGAYRLRAQAVERNLFGRDKSLTLRAGIDPLTLSVGELYYDPRVLGGELSVDESLDVIFNRDTGAAEGSMGELALGRPWRALGQTWSWGASASYANFVARTLQGSQVASFRRTSSGAREPCLQDAPECIRRVWDDHSHQLHLGATYHRGVRYTQTFGFGLGYSQRSVRANDETRLQPDQRETFERYVLPRQRRQVYPSASYGLSVPSYVVFHDLGTFGQSETVRTGPALSTDMTLPLRAFGSSSDSVRFSGGIGYVLGDGSGLAEVATSAGARLEDGSVVDQTLGATLRGATPEWFYGRMIGLVSWSAQRNDTSNSEVSLGGDNGLRGYRSGAYLTLGGSRVRGSVEYRTQPVVLSSVHVGAVAFYDAGSVYTALRAAQFHHSVGVGLRVLFPQINRTPFSMDFGVPLDGRGFNVLVSYGTEQAVPLTAYDDAVAAAQP